MVDKVRLNRTINKQQREVWGGGVIKALGGINIQLTEHSWGPAAAGGLRDDDGCHLVGDYGLGLVVVDVDRLEGAHTKRLPAVCHPVAMDTFKWRCGRDGLWRCAGSCTHAPQAAVNDIVAELVDQEATNTRCIFTHKHLRRETERSCFTPEESCVEIKGIGTC